MRSLIDFSSWQGVLATVLGLAVITLVMVGIRLLVMQTVQQRRQRENRQVNERLRLLIAAYKVLGGSFTGDLSVDPTHLRDLRRDAERSDADGTHGDDTTAGSGRRRRIRDAVEAALSDVILLGTEAQVRLAAQAASDLAAGRPVETAALVVSLRDFVREVLDLEPVPADLVIPRQGATRPSGTSASRGRESRRGTDAERSGVGAGAGAAGAGGVGLGVGLGGKNEPDR